MTGRVFVLGLQRSGTTWLANMLAALPQVTAVAHEDHQGVHESVFFSHFARNFGPWEDPSARHQFAEAFGQSDYYRLTGLEAAVLPRLMETCDSYGAVFVAVMDEMTKAQGAAMWVEKSPHHTLLTDDILRAAPDARFVMVERGLPDLVASRLHGFGRTPGRDLKFWRDVMRGALTASLYRREMRRLARAGRGLLLRYEELKDDKDGTTRAAVLSYLGLEAHPHDMKSAYRPNSSFRQKPVALGSVARFVISCVATISAVIPLRVLLRLQSQRDAARGADWPDWVWSQTGYDPDEGPRG